MKKFSELLAVLAVCLSIAMCDREPDLDPIKSLPSFDLVDHENRSFSLEDLRGHVSIVDFIFTRCGATCPVLTAEMKRLTDDLSDDDLRFVSITVDPAYDTPSVLSEYRQKVTNDPRWTFLTGERDEIERLSIEGFNLAVGTSQNPAEPILHSNRFVLVDREGVIRNYYDSGRPEVMADLRSDARWLARKSEE
ncbi:MAG: SCO family protein [Acidobacteria bacterium]|nr:SCO family protein [Acidobacteriota bacterium]